LQNNYIIKFSISPLNKKNTFNHLIIFMETITKKRK
jgi:hypothetical protein